MADNILFERTIKGNVSDIYVRLSSDEALPLAMSKPVNVVINEAFSYASPIITITFVDGYGMYFTVDKLNPSHMFYLTVGKNETTDKFDIPLKIAKVSFKNTVGGIAEYVAYTITFVHTGWNELINTRHNRGWINTTYSNVIEEIVNESGYDSVDISPSKNTIENIIQPHWTNLKFMKWIQQRSNPVNYDDHFEFWCDINGNFKWKSLSNIIDDKMDDIKSGNIPVLRMYTDDIGENPDKIDYASYFTDFKGAEFYIDSVINGLGGTKPTHYDFETGDVVSSETRIDMMNAYTTSDWTALREEHQASHTMMFLGRDTNSPVMGRVKLSNVGISSNKFTITTDGSLAVHVGDVVELIIKRNPESFREVLTLLYSGIYVVANVTHHMVFGEQNRYITVIDLARHGHDNKQDEGYLATSLGKMV